MEKWICSCGQENTGKFCSACGKVQPQAEEQPEEQHEERTASSLAIANSKKSVQTDTPAVRPQPIDESTPLLKKWGSSILMLVFAIATSVYALIELISLFFSFGNTSQLLSSLVDILIAALVCAGAWRIYANAKSQTMPLQSGGHKMLRGCFVYYEVIVSIVLALVMLLAFIIVCIGSAVAQTSDKLTAIFTALGLDMSLINNLVKMGNMIFIVLLILAVAIFVVAILAFTAVRKDMHDLIRLIEKPGVKVLPTIKGAVFMFIFAGLSIGLFVINIISGNVMAIISSLMQVAMFVLGGILLLKFNKTRVALKV